MIAIVGICYLLAKEIKTKDPEASHIVCDEIGLEAFK
jgi:hypothetical protein